MRIRPVALRRRLLYLAAAAIVPLAVMSGVSLLALLPVDTATLADVLARP